MVYDHAPLWTFLILIFSSQHVFDVVRTAGSATYNFANPVRRDVVNVGNLGDLVTFRFVTDNQGALKLAFRG